MGLSLQVLSLTTKKAIRLASAAVLFLYFPSPFIFAQELSRPIELAGQKILVTLEPLEASCQKPKVISLNKLFCLRVTVKGANEVWLKGLKVSKFDAVMPAHRHGMITRPKIKAEKTGQYLIEGVKLHMSGDWSLELKMEHSQTSSQVAIPLKL
jgi:hypothetical protein